MDRRELINDFNVTLDACLQGLQSRIWTALPCVVQSFDPSVMTITAQPAVMGYRRNPDGTTDTITMPLLVDVPVQFPGAGGVSMTFAVAPGDECLIVFSSRCIDGWWYLGGVQEQVEKRRHDLSDGMAILGFRSKPRALSNVSTTSTQLRSDDGETYVELDPAAGSLKLRDKGESVLHMKGNGLVELMCQSFTVRASSQISLHAADGLLAGPNVDAIDLPVKLSDGSNSPVWNAVKVP